MSSLPFETCWTMLRGAAAGDTGACNAFADTYLRVVRSFLLGRWRGSRAIQLVDDAVQEVFLDFFRRDGALARLAPERTRAFRGFLFGVTDKVARRFEERMQRDLRSAGDDPELVRLPSREEPLSVMFDRAWAHRLLRRAAERQRQQATAGDAGLRRRVELLHLRFEEGLPIREIARRFDQDPVRVHREYARAREEFKQCLRAEVAFHRQGDMSDVEAECRELLGLVR